MIEIERKFLVSDEPNLGACEPVDIRQGYLTIPSDSLSVRLRKKGGRCFLTAKGKGGIARQEIESEISTVAFEQFWPLTQGRRLQKTRWIGALPNGLKYELDVFQGGLAPLRLVEVEFATLGQAQAFCPPSWFGRDVTEDAAFGNRSLATNGFPIKRL